jgi:hypothetical protein
MHVHRDKTFSSQSFELEDISFINCQLKDCDLFYSGGDFDFQECRFESCRFHWRGHAKNTVSLLQSIGALRPQMLPVSVAPGQAGQPPRAN